MASRQHLVVRAEAERADHSVETGRRVRDEDEVLWADADKRGECRARFGQQIVEAAPEELRGVALEFALQLLVAGEHRSRAGAVGAVVEIDDVRIEQELHAVTVSRC